jgi:hypothetical protein
VEVGAAKAEGADPGAAQIVAVGPPGPELPVDVEGRVGEVDVRVRPLESEAGRQLFLVEGQHRLEHAGGAGGAFQVA